MAAVAQNWPRISMGGPAVAHGPILMSATVSCLAVSIPYEGRQRWTKLAPDLWRRSVYSLLTFCPMWVILSVVLPVTVGGQPPILRG